MVAPIRELVGRVLELPDESEKQSDVGKSYQEPQICNEYCRMLLTGVYASRNNMKFCQDMEILPITMVRLDSAANGHCGSSGKLP